MSFAAPQLKIVTEHLPPFQMDTAQGVTGYASEIVQATMAHAKIDYSIEVMSWSRAYNLALRDANTCIYSISKGAEREPHFQWIGAISYSVTSIYSLKAPRYSDQNHRRRKEIHNCGHQRRYHTSLFA
ncbi:MAG: hypothetical protein U5L01_13935 [Rheinheimera sp.]|nr:hypothetical protein [Rheinheimera sp.]